MQWYPMFDAHNLKQNVLFSSLLVASHSTVAPSEVPACWISIAKVKSTVVHLTQSIHCCINQWIRGLANVTFCSFHSKNFNGTTGSTHQADTERIIVPAPAISHFHMMLAQQIMQSFKHWPICCSPMTFRSHAVLPPNYNRFHFYTANQTINSTSNVIATWSPNRALANEFSFGAIQFSNSIENLRSKNQF